MTPLILAAVFACASPGVIDGDTLKCADATPVEWEAFSKGYYRGIGR